VCGKPPRTQVRTCPMAATHREGAPIALREQRNVALQHRAINL
jgi:hypothetical protein